MKEIEPCDLQCTKNNDIGYDKMTEIEFTDVELNGFYLLQGRNQTPSHHRQWVVLLLSVSILK